MEIIPAIDIRGGRCVRLRQGDYAAETVFDDDPVAVAKRWLGAGATRLHVVDLDGARAGAPASFDIVVAIARLGIATQVGGGIRATETVKRYLAAGLDRVILGTAAVNDLALMEALCRDCGPAVVVSLDARGGRLATEGWTQTTDYRAEDLAVLLAELGVRRFIYTDIERDGTLTEPNYAALEHLAAVVDRPVIASGGVARAEQLSRLADAGLEGVIIGRALYDGRVDLERALAAGRAAG